MKKVISVLVAALMLVASVPAFAASTGVDAEYIFYSDMNLGNGKTLDKLDTESQQLTDAIVYAPNNTAETTTTYGVIENEALVTGLYNNEVGSLLYFTSGAMSSFKGYNNLSWGFDFKLDGVTEDIPENQSIMDVTARAATPFAEAGGTSGASAGTCWYTGMSFGVSATEERTAENLPVLKSGDVVITPGVVYTFISFMDFVNHSFETGIIDGDGVYTTVKTGSLNAVLKDFGGFQYAHSAGATTAVKSTIDNVFVKETSSLGFVSGDTLSVSDDGKVSFTAFIPEYATDAKLYVNNTFVEDIETEAGKDKYEITATLPEGTAFGENVFELRAKHAGADISGTKTISLIKEGKILLKTLEAGEIAMAEKKYSANYTGGLYEVTLDFKVGKDASLNFRFLQDALNGSSGTNFSGSSTPNIGWNPWRLNEDRFAAANIDTTAQNWNTASLLIDYRGNAILNSCPYVLTINGVVVDKGTHKVKSLANSINGFVQVGVSGSAGTVGEAAAEAKFKNIQLFEHKDISVNALEINTTNKEGKTTAYNDEAVVSYGLDKIEVKYNKTITIADGGIKFVNSKGDVAEGATVSLSGDTATVKLDEDTILPSDIYYIVVSKNAKVDGVTLGADIKTEIAVANRSAVLSPAKNEVISGEKVNLSAYVPNADKVLFYINDALVHEFETVSETGIYTYAAELGETGVKYFDVYAYSGNDVSLRSSVFTYKNYAKYNEWSSSTTGTVPVGGQKDVGNSGVRYAGRMAFEAVMTIPKTGDNIKVEIGGASTFGYTWGNASTGWFSNIHDISPLFCADGKVAGTNYSYPVNEEFTLKYVCDPENDTFEMYINGNHVFTKKSTGNLAKAIITGSKIRFIHTDADASGDGNPTISSLKSYQEYTAASVSGVTFDGKDASTEAGFVVAEGSESISLIFDKAYTSFDPQLLVVKLNGSEVSQDLYNASYVADTKTLTITGLTLKAGSKIEVEIPASTQMDLSVVAVDNSETTAKVPAGSKMCQTIFVGDKDKVCVLPLKLKTNDGYDILAYSKYINGSNGNVETYLIIAEYTNENRIAVRKTSFTTVSMEAGEAGCVSGYLDGVLSASGCSVMLWNTSYAPLVSAETLPAE